MNVFKVSFFVLSFLAVSTVNAQTGQTGSNGKQINASAFSNPKAIEAKQMNTEVKKNESVSSEKNSTEPKAVNSEAPKKNIEVQKRKEER